MVSTSHHRREQRAALAGMVAAAFVIAQQVGSKATRDTLFLTHWDAADLPRVMLAAAVLSLVGVLAMSRLMPSMGPARIVPAAFVLSAVLFGAEWFLLEQHPRPIAVFIYLHIAAFGLIVVSGFWSVVNECFDPHSAKKVMWRIGAGATFGGLAGGLAAERVGAWLDVRSMLLVLLVLNLICAVSLGALRSAESEVRAGGTKSGSRLSGFTVLKEVRYLRHVGAIVLLVAVATALLDFAVKARAQQDLSQQHLMSFFAIFYTAAGLLTFLLQTTASKRALQKLGLGGTIALLPLVIFVGGAIGAFATRLWTVVIAKGSETVVANSLFRSGYELLYTPLSPDKKRPTKTIIDVAFQRVGDAIGSGLALAILALAFAHSTQIVLGLASAAAALALWLTRGLQRGYVAELAERLRTGQVELTDSDVMDATTQKTLHETMSIDVQQLRAQLRGLRGQPDEQTPPADDSIEPGREPPVVRDAASLLSNQAGRITTVLKSEPLDPRLVPFTIPLLARQDVGRKALGALKKLAPDVTGQLVDGLIDPRQPVVVRRRLPRALRGCENQLAVFGLLRGLADAEFEVRYHCARALAHVTRRRPDLEVPRDQVLAAAATELEVGRRKWDSHRLLDVDLEVDESDSIDPDRHARFHTSLRHLFTVLSLVLEREPLELAVRALAVDDLILRGTGLEYLENVLPPAVWSGLSPYLVDARLTKRPRRTQRAIVEDLVKSMESVAIDRANLRNL